MTATHRPRGEDPPPVTADQPGRRIEYLPLDDLIGAPRNPKRHDTNLVRASIARFGYTAPALRDERTGRLVVGHGRTEALRAMRDDGETPPAGVTLDPAGRWLVPVIRGWASRSDPEAEAYLVADNQHTILGGWDDPQLGEVLADLAELDAELLDVTGFDEADLEALLEPDEFGGGPSRGGGLTDPDDAPEQPAEPISTFGDVWLLGRHRLLCGDAMKRDNYARLLGDERPDLLLTDPPYGVAVGGDKGKNSISGDLTQAAIPVSFALCLDVLADDARIYLFGGSANWGMYAGLFDVHLRMQPRLIVWVKENFILRRTGYHSQFEMIYYGWKGAGGDLACWFGDRRASDVWRVSRDVIGERHHPTQKPVEACAIPIVNSSPPGGLVLEPFAGSGSTLIAAHIHGRTCRAIEMDPRYADVVCRRYQTYTGELPILESTGRPVDFAAGGDT